MPSVRMVDLVQRIQNERKRAERNQKVREGYEPGEITVMRREERARRQAERQQKIADAREKYLSDEDKLVASTYALPNGRAARVADARRLAHSESGRRRTHKEIAAIMGLSYGSISGYFYDPEMEYIKAWQEQHPRGSKARADLPTAPPLDEPVPEGEPETVQPFGRMLKARRKRNRISQVELAEQLGWDVERLREIEATDTWPTPGTWMEIRAALEHIESPAEDE